MTAIWALRNVDAEQGIFFFWPQMNKQINDMVLSQV
jgi:hypothetical protein